MRHKKLLFTIALLLTFGQGAWAQDQWKTINDGEVHVGVGQHFYISGTGETTSNQISIKSGGMVTLSNVKISNVDYCIQCDGEATIILEDGTVNTLTSTGVLFGKKNASDPWEEIFFSHKEHNLPADNNQTTELPFNRTSLGDMRIFRLEVVENWSDDKYMQLGGLNFNYDD